MHRNLHIAINACIEGLNYHDPSIAISIDNDIVFLGEEERYNKVKHSPGIFPEMCLTDAIKELSLNKKDTPIIHIPHNPLKRDKSNVSGLLFYEMILREILDKYFEQYEIKFHEHHLCHAAAAHHYSKSNKSIAYVFDGAGETNSATVYEFIGKEYSTLFEVDIKESLAYLYSAITKLLGFEPWDQEGKTMALAPYGNDNSMLSVKYLNYFKSNKWKFKIEKNLYNGAHLKIDKLASEIKKELGITVSDGFSVMEERYASLAYSIQEYVKSEVESIVQKFSREGYKNVYSGGLFLNCKLTQEISREVCDNTYYVQPTPADNGTVLGALVLGSDFKLNNNYYPHYCMDSHNNQALDMKVINQCVDLLLLGKIGLIFDGYMEFGPRALGHRSIIANPAFSDISLRTNNIKNREEWRPFALSTTSETANDIFCNYVDDDSSHYMIKTYKVKSDFIKLLSQAIHVVDNTCRPQIVSPKYNLFYFTLIDSFINASNIPGILNTSLNNRGEPIIKDECAAISFIHERNLDFGVINGRLIVNDSATD